jgi:long-chain acyl-CoA synthetase
VSTISEAFFAVAKESPDAPALQVRAKKTWTAISYGELAAKVEACAAALAARGVGHGDRVAILSENQPAWAIFDLAILSLGAIAVPIYPSLPAPQVAYILKNSGAKGALAGDEKLNARLQEARSDAPEVVWTVVAGEEFEAFLQEGEKAPKPTSKPVPDDVASLVYTSGTTGDPKGAMLTHANFLTNVQGARDVLSEIGAPLGAGDLWLSFLPLSHVFERMAGHFLPLCFGACIAYSGGIRTLAEDMKTAQPTIMVCVPRVWEAMQERILDGVAKADPKKRALFEKTQAVGRAWLEGKRGPILWVQKLILDRLVGRAARERFGGRFRFWVSGGAALNPEVARFFAALGIEILEGYGMTESAPVIAVNRPGRIRIGTVGTVIPGGKIKIAPDGEICYSGPNVMKGYWNNPAATQEMIDADGWLHTGDIGVLAPDGFLRITDRKKDIIVLANGKNVAPQPIEATLKQSPFLTEIVLIGDKQSVVTALVVPNKEKLKEWAASEGRTYETDDALLQSPETKKKLKAEIDAHSGALAEFERVRRFAVLNTTFSVEGGELTPTLKIKRKVVLQKYATEVAELRGDD